MKILQLCNKAPFPSNDGSSIAIMNMALGLVQAGAEVQLFTLNTKKHYKKIENLPSPFVNNQNFHTIYCDTDTRLNGAIMNLFSNQSYFVSRFYVNEFSAKLKSIVQKFKPDIVQLEGLAMGVYLNEIKSYSKAKICLRAHNVEYLIWERFSKNIKNPLKKWYFKIQIERLKKFEISVMQNVDQIVAITPNDKKMIASISSVKTITALTGVNVKDYTIQKSKDFNDCSIFHFGSMDWMPNKEGVDWFLNECWDQILEVFPKCQLIIAGRNIPKHYKIIKNKNIVIRENVADPNTIYNSYNLMIVPILSGSGLRIKIVEGMSYGKAIVSTEIGAEGIDIVPNQDLVLANHSSTFINEIIRLLKNPNAVQSIEKNARHFAEKKFDNKQICSQVFNSYLDVIN